MRSEGDAAIHERGADVVAVLTSGRDRIEADLMDRLPKLRLIAAVGAGYEGVDVAAAKLRGITVANAGDTHSGDVADHAVALTLATLRGWSHIGAVVRAMVACQATAVLVSLLIASRSLPAGRAVICSRPRRSPPC